MNVPMRLKEVREELGLSQEAMGRLGGVTKLTQFNYEAGSRAPDTNYLCALSDAGVDVAYVITGVRGMGTLSRREQAVLDHYRNTNEEGQKVIEQTALFAAQSAQKASGKKRA